MLKTKEIEKPSKMGRPVIHGGYSIRTPKDLIKGQARQRLRKYLTDFRAGLTRDLGGEDQLTAAQVVLIDRALANLHLVRLIEIYTAEAGPWAEPGKLRHVLPGPYVTFARELREDLRLLGITRKLPEAIEVLPWDVKDEAEGGKEN